MPELPEVETTTQGIAPFLKACTIRSVIIRNPNLRIKLTDDFPRLCSGRVILEVYRRAKYILCRLDKGYILIHLGMSGHLRVVPSDAPINKHDHIDIVLDSNLALRYCDPRRFGLIIHIENDPLAHPLLSHLGPEPLSADFNSLYLIQKTKNKSKPIKSVLMDNQIVVGVGNIYASECLFLAKIHPATPAKNISSTTLQLLVTKIKSVLEYAINQGGTTLRDFYGSDGKPGYFSLSLQVYGRKNQTCYQCNTLIDSVRIAGRQSAFCPACQVLT